MITSRVVRYNKISIWLDLVGWFLIIAILNVAMLATVISLETGHSATDAIVTIKESAIKPKKVNFISIELESQARQLHDARENSEDSSIHSKVKGERQEDDGTFLETINNHLAIMRNQCLVTDAIHDTGLVMKSAPSGDGRFTKTLLNDAINSDEPIYINGDSDFAAQAASRGWTGNGSASNPYIIEGLTVEVLTNETYVAIYIANTTVHFIIRDTLVRRGPPTGSYRIEELRGFHFVNVSNGMIKNVTVTDLYVGILFENSSYLRVSDSTVGDVLGDGYRVGNSKNVSLINNEFFSTDAGRRRNLNLGVVIYDSTGIVLLDNNVSNSGIYGIALSNVSDYTMVGNVIQGGDFAGIGLHASPNGIISNNTLINTGMEVGGGNITDLIQIKVENNSVNDKPLVFMQNQVGGVIEEPAGQIILVNSTSIEIKNQVISNTTTGITLLYSNNNTLKNNVVLNTTNDAFFILNSNNTIVKQNIAADSRDSGFYFISASNLTALENEAWRNSVGMVVSKGLNLHLENNSMTFNDMGLLVGVLNGSISLVHNVLTNNTYEGIRITRSKSILIRQNLVSNNQVGIKSLGSPWLMIDHNTISDNSAAGIMLEENDPNDRTTIIGNKLLRNDYGIYVKSSSRLVVSDNIVASNEFDGILLDGDSSNSIYENNTIFDNDDGISATELGLNTTFTGNTFFFNRGYGINLMSDASQYDVLKNNFMENNLVKGLSQSYSNSPSNFFARNFWSQFVTPDGDNNGIVDMPYQVEGYGNNVDSEPVTTPYVNPFISDPPQLTITIPDKEHAFYFADNSTAGQSFNILLSWEIATNNPVIQEVSRNYTLETTQLILNSSFIHFYDTLRIPPISTTYLYNITVTDVFGQQVSDQIFVKFVLKSEATSSKNSNQGKGLFDLRIDGFLGFSMVVVIGGLAIMKKKRRRPQ